MCKIIVIGSSTGGPKTLEVLLAALPADFPVSVLIAQHLTAAFTASLAKRLDRVSELIVTEIKNEQMVKPGHAYVIPGDCHFFFTHSERAVGEYRVHLIPAKELPKPSIDMGLVSTAEHFGPGTIGVILSGMGVDGLIGAKAVKQLGGRVLVQDEASSVIFGMGARVIEAGLADEVLPLNKIAQRLTQLAEDIKT